MKSRIGSIGVGFFLAATAISHASQASESFGPHAHYPIVKRDVPVAAVTYSKSVHRVGPRDTIVVNRAIAPAAQFASLDVEFTLAVAKDPTTGCRPYRNGPRETMKRCRAQR